MQFIQYHHISYNGVQYYYLDSDIEIPNEYIPFGDSVILIIGGAIVGCFAIPWWVKLIITAYYVGRLIYDFIQLRYARTKTQKAEIYLSIGLNIFGIFATWLSMPLSLLANASVGRSIFNMIAIVLGPAFANCVALVQIIKSAR